MLYSNTIKHSYVLDDNSVLAKNSIVTQGLHGIPLIINSSYRSGSNYLTDDLYRPLSQVMFAIEWQISPNNPFLNHFINVLFYAISCLLLFLVLRKYLNNLHIIIPFVITLLYTAHPIHTEVVANIKSRDEIMSFFFLMITLLLLHIWFAKQRLWSLILSLLAFFLSLVSKEGVFTMLLIFPIIGWYFTNSKSKTILTTSLILVLPAVVYITIRYYILSKYQIPLTITVFDNFLVGATGLISHFATTIMLLGKYLFLLIIPYQLVCDYSYNQIQIIGLTDIRFILAMMFYLSIVVYILLNCKKKELIAFGLLFFLVSLSLYSNIFFKIGTSFGERLMFLPSLGICIAFVLVIAKLLKVEIYDNSPSIIKFLRSKPIFTLIFLIILPLFSLKTVIRAEEWKNQYSLFSCDVKRSPNSARIRFGLGNMLFDKAEIEKEKDRKDAIMLQSIEQYEKGLSIFPTYADCYGQLCLARFELGDTNKAILNANLAIKSNSAKALTWYNIGLFYLKIGDLQKSMTFTKKSININPYYSNAYLNVGCVLFETKKYEEAISEFKKCIKYDPRNITSYKNVGICYEKLNNQEEANLWYEKANALNYQ